MVSSTESVSLTTIIKQYRSPRSTRTGTSAAAALLHLFSLLSPLSVSPQTESWSCQASPSVLPSSPPISPRRAWSVSECLLTITLSDRQTISEASLTPLALRSLHLHSAGTPPATKPSEPQMKSGPMSPEMREAWEEYFNSLHMVPLEPAVEKWILIADVRFDLKSVRWVSALISCNTVLLSHYQTVSTVWYLK